MRYRPFGNTGLQVSEIGFGGWGIGGGWGEQDDQGALAALGRAIELGVNFFDTAYAYGDGHSEKLIGQAIGRRRDKMVIATKIPPQTFKWPVKDDEPVATTFNEKWIIQCTERSLKMLGTDYLDIQQLHAWADAYNEQLEWHEALTKLQKQGKVRFFGVSANDWDPFGPQRLVESGRIDSLQVIFNLFEQRPADALLPAAKQAGIGVIVRVPFEEGLLTGNIRPGHRFESDDWRSTWLSPERLAAAEPRIKAIEDELDDDYADLPGLALGFVLGHEAVSTVIPGMRRIEHVQANCRVAGLPPLGSGRLQSLKSHRFVHGWAYPWSQT